MSTPVVAIVGRPNVGKSTIFNRIAGERISIVEDTPGVTRDRIYAQTEWLGRKFNLIDTGGIDIGDEPFLTQITEQAQIAIDEADAIIFVVSVKEGVTDADEKVARILYQTDKPVLLAVNKVDNPVPPPMATIFGPLFNFLLLNNFSKTSSLSRVSRISNKE